MKQQIVAVCLVVLTIAVAGCGTGQALAPTETPSPPTDTPLPPTHAPRPTPQPFTSPVTPGVWTGLGKLELSSGDVAEFDVTFLIDGSGVVVSRWQLGFPHCSKMAGGSDDTPIEKGVFTFEIDNPCESGGKMIITGVFASATELEGILTADSFSGEWDAKPE